MPWQSREAQIPEPSMAAPTESDLPLPEDEPEENQSSRKRKNKLNDLMPKSKSKK
jgi:hypothetical protein